MLDVIPHRELHGFLLYSAGLTLDPDPSAQGTPAQPCRWLANLVKALSLLKQSLCAAELFTQACIVTSLQRRIWYEYRITKTQRPPPPQQKKNEK